MYIYIERHRQNKSHMKERQYNGKMCRATLWSPYDMGMELWSVEYRV